MIVVSSASATASVATIVALKARAFANVRSATRSSSRNRCMFSRLRLRCRELDGSEPRRAYMALITPPEKHFHAGHIGDVGEPHRHAIEAARVERGENPIHVVLVCCGRALI